MDGNIMGSIRVNGSTSGSVTLNAPATGSDVSLTLPTLGFGKVLQIVQGSLSTVATSTSSTYADTGLSASITPSATTSKVLVIVNHNGCSKSLSNTALQLRLLRGASVISMIEGFAGYNGGTGTNAIGSINFIWLDSPASTSSLTYKTQFASSANASNVRVNDYVSSNGDSVSTLTLIEVSA